MLAENDRLTKVFFNDVISHHWYYPYEHHKLDEAPAWLTVYRVRAEVIPNYGVLVVRMRELNFAFA